MYLHFICGWFKISCPVNVVAYSFLIRGREGHRQEQVPIFPWPDTRDARAVARTDHHHSAPDRAPCPCAHAPRAHSRRSGP